MLFMVPLGLPSARPMAQALRLPFEYYIFIYFVYISFKSLFYTLLLYVFISSLLHIY